MATYGPVLQYPPLTLPLRFYITITDHHNDTVYQFSLTTINYNYHSFILLETLSFPDIDLDDLDDDSFSFIVDPLTSVEHRLARIVARFDNMKATLDRLIERTDRIIETLDFIVDRLPPIAGGLPAPPHGAILPALGIPAAP